jgi:hypothetical protein
MEVSKMADKVNVLQGHSTEDTAFVVADYPYGFRLRTQIRYWIETTKHGDRFVSQTLNPKTGKWNAPKKSTYSDVIVMVRDESNGHIGYISWSPDYTEQKDLDSFLQRVGDYAFSDAQKERIKYGRAIYKTREHITVEIVNVTNETEEQRQEREAAKKALAEDLQKMFGYYVHQENVKEAAE